MKVYVVLRNTFPVGNASTVRVYNYCKGFVNLGIECEVILPIAFEKYGYPKKNKLAEGVYDGIHYKYISGNSQRGKYSAFRFIKDKIDYCNTLLYLYKKIKKEDVVIVYEGGCFWFRNLVKVVHLKGAKVVMELNELPYGTGVESSKNVTLRRKMCSQIFPLFDGFLSISHSLSDLVKKSAPNSKNLIVPIIVDSSIADKVAPKILERKYIFHSGSLYEQKDGVCGMLEAFAIANQKLGNSMDFILTGNIESSRDKDKILAVIEKYKIKEYVKFVGYLSLEDLYSYQAGSSLMIINKLETQQNKYCFSTKLGEYLAFAKPVIITNVGEAMYYLNNENSYIAEANNPYSIAENIIKIKNEEEVAKSIGKNGKMLADQEFSCFYQAKRIVKFFDSL